MGKKSNKVKKEKVVVICEPIDDADLVAELDEHFQKYVSGTEKLNYLFISKPNGKKIFEITKLKDENNKHIDLKVYVNVEAYEEFCLDEEKFEIKMKELATYVKFEEGNKIKIVKIEQMKNEYLIETYGMDKMKEMFDLEHIICNPPKEEE